MSDKKPAVHSFMFKNLVDESKDLAVQIAKHLDTLRLVDEPKTSLALLRVLVNNLRRHMGLAETSMLVMAMWGLVGSQKSESKDAVHPARQLREGDLDIELTDGQLKHLIDKKMIFHCLCGAWHGVEEVGEKELKAALKGGATTVM